MRSLASFTLPYARSSNRKRNALITADRRSHLRVLTRLVARDASPCDELWRNGDETSRCAVPRPGLERQALRTKCIGFAGLTCDASHEHAPRAVVIVVAAVSLERDDGFDRGSIEFGARYGTKEDRAVA